MTYWFVNLSPSEPARLLLGAVADAASAGWYRVTAASLAASEVRLNGKVLRSEGGELALVSGVQEPSSMLGSSIAPASYAFAVVDADAPACR